MESIRRGVRIEIAIAREIHRNTEKDNLRQLDEAKDAETEKDVHMLARKLSKKSMVTHQLLGSISNALLKGENYVNAFLDVDSALPGLLRLFYFFHRDAQLQLSALHCLCNIALGDEKACLKLAKAAGPFLIMRLEGMNLYVSEACAWTIGNMSRFSSVVSLLRDQGAYSHLCKLLETTDNEDLRSGAVASLIHATHNCLHVFRPEDCLLIVQTALSIKDPKPDLIFLLSLLSSEQQVLNVYKNRGIATVILNSLWQLSHENGGDVAHILSSVRLLANAVAEESGETAKIILESPCLATVTKRLLNNPEDFIVRETLWFLGNLVCHPLLEIRQLSQTCGISSWTECIGQ